MRLETLSVVTSQNGKTLQILNCWWGYKFRGSTSWDSRELDFHSMKCILKNCTELKELNFWNEVSQENVKMNYNCEIRPEVIDYLVKNISPEIEKFSIYEPWLRFRDDRNLKDLVRRCTKLKAIRFAARGIILQTSIFNAPNIYWLQDIGNGLFYLWAHKDNKCKYLNNDF